MATPRRHPALQDSEVVPADRGAAPAGAVREPRPARAPAAPGRRRPQGRQARRAPGRDALRAERPRHAAALVVYFTVKFDTPMSFMEHLDRLRLSTTGIGVGLFLALFGIGAGADPLGEDAHAGRGAGRGPARPARVGRRTATTRSTHPQGGRRGVRPRPPPAHPQLAHRRAGARAAARRRAAARHRPAAGQRPLHDVLEGGHAAAHGPADAADPAPGHADRVGRPHRAGGPDRADARTTWRRRPRPRCSCCGSTRATSTPRSQPGAYEGIVAYSKICTHMGCPVALYEQQTHHLLCPCHQSTFDVTQDCKVIFGPAKRPLPQLAITLDDGRIFGSEARLPRGRRTELLGARMSASARAAGDVGNFLDERVGASKGVKSSSARSSPTTGRSCWARSPSTASSSCC